MIFFLHLSGMIALVFFIKNLKKTSLDFYVSTAERLDLFNTVLRILCESLLVLWCKSMKSASLQDPGCSFFFVTRQYRVVNISHGAE